MVSRTAIAPTADGVGFRSCGSAAQTSQVPSTSRSNHNARWQGMVDCRLSGAISHGDGAWDSLRIPKGPDISRHQEPPQRWAAKVAILRRLPVTAIVIADYGTNAWLAFDRRALASPAVAQTAFEPGRSLPKSRSGYIRNLRWCAASRRSIMPIPTWRRSAWERPGRSVTASMGRLLPAGTAGEAPAARMDILVSSMQNRLALEENR